MGSVSKLARCLSLSLMLLSGCQISMDQGALDSGGEAGMDAGIEIRSSKHALSASSLCGNMAGLASPWSMWGACPGAGSRSLELGPLASGEAWGIDTLNDVRSSPVLSAANEIIVGSVSGKLYKVSSTGTILKELAFGSALRSTAAISATGAVYIGGDNGLFRAIDLATFGIKWTYTAGGATSSPVILSDGTVVFGSAAKKVVALKPDGMQRWVYPTTGTMTGSAASSSPVVSPDGLRIHIGTSDGYLVTLNASTGALIRSTKLSGATSSPAMTKLGLVVIGSGSTLYALDSVANTIVWQRALGGTVASPAISAEGTIRVGVNKGILAGGTFYSLRASDGLPLYEVALLGGVETTAVIDANDVSYLGANDGVILGISSSGSIVFKHVLPAGALAGVRSSALILRNTLIVGGDDNWLRAIGTGTPPALLPAGGTCKTDNDCEPGLICGVGIGAQLGKPAGSNACWPPSCSNKVKDPSETDVDCGSAACGSCASLCSQACTVGSQVTPPALEVLSFSKGAFSRGSIASYQSSANTLVIARGDQLRFEDRSDGNGRVALFEGPRTNRVVWSEQMTNSPSWWTGLAQTPTMTFTEDAAVGPTGLQTAERVSAQAGANASRAQTIVNAMPVGSLSVWLRLTDPAAFNPASPLKTRAVLTDLTGGWYNEAVDWRLTSAWTRRSLTTKPATKSTAIQLTHKPAWPGSATEFPALPAADFAVFGWQLEESVFPSSYIPTQESALTRKGDLVVFAASDVPAWVHTGKWQIDVLPLFSSAEIATTDEFVIMAWDGGHVSLSKDATGGLVKVVSGTTTAKRTIAWTRNRKLTLTIDATAKTLQVVGASTGDGSQSYGSFAIAAGRVGVGALLNGTKPAFARISEMRRVASATVACVADPDCVVCGDGRKTGSEACDTALDAHCSRDCKQVNSGPVVGDSDADCPAGQVILPNGGGRFGLRDDADVCWPGSGICPFACGTKASPCGECVPEAVCANKQCGANSDDGHGGYCTDLCQPLQPGCLLDSDCTAGYSCGIGMGPRMGKAAGTNICWPVECDDYMPTRLACGTIASKCGLCPVLPNECGDKVCGADRYGHACGTCANGLRCNAEGSCISTVLLNNPLDSTILDVLLPVATSTAGTIEGAFAVSEAGTATYTVPLKVPPGRGGMQPNLSLVYDSGRGDGVLTAGWSLSGLSMITRCPNNFARDGEAHGVDLTRADRFCIDGQPLFSVDRTIDRPGPSDIYGLNGTEYRTELDSFVKVVSYDERPLELNGAPASYAGPSHFKAWTKAGQVLTFGKAWSATSWAVPNTLDHHRVVNVAWMVNKVEDNHGNAISIEYERFTRGYSKNRIVNPEFEPATFQYTAEARPKVISYGANGSHRVEIIYSSENFSSGNADPSLNGIPKLGWMPRSFVAGIGRFISQPISEVRSFINDEKVYSYKFETGLVERRWKLKSLTECASEGQKEYCRPPTRFEYEPTVPLTHDGESPDTLGGHIVVSHKPDDGWFGCSDDRQFYPGNLSRFFALTANLDGDARDDLITTQITDGKAVDCSWSTVFDLYKRNSIPRSLPGGPVFSSPAPWDPNPSVAFQQNLAKLDWPPQSYADRIKPYTLIDSDLDGKDDELSLAHPSERPDLNGDGLKDKVTCTSATNKWAHSLAIAPATASSPATFGPSQPSSITLDCNFISTDFDRDGADDLLVTSKESLKLHVISLSKGKLVARALGAPWWIANADLRTSNAYLRFLDANGDGLLDFIHQSDKDDTRRMNLYLGTGWDFILYNDFNLGGPDDEAFLFEYSFIMDHDGDGRDELFVPSDRSGEANDKWIMVESFAPEALNKARRTTTAMPYRKVKIISANDEAPTTPRYDWQKPIVLDWDGNGVSDVVFRSGDLQDPTVDLWKGGSKRSGLLNKITDGLSRVTTIQYADRPEDEAYRMGKGCKYPQRCLPKLPHPIVKSHETTVDIGPFSQPNVVKAAYSRRRFEYEYEDARADVRGRGWLGFRKSTTREVAFDFPGTKFSETVTEYDLTTEVAPLKLFAFAGRPSTLVKRTFSTMRDGTPVTHEDRQIFDWELRASESKRPWLALRTHTAITKENGFELARTSTTRTYDLYGNAEEVTTLSSDGRLTTSTSSFTNHPQWEALKANWQVGLLATVTIVGVDTVLKPESLREVKTSKIVNTYDAVGDLRTVERFAGNRSEQLTSLKYDAYGNIIRSQVSGRLNPGGISEVAYDDQGMFPIRSWTDTHTLHAMSDRKIGFDLRTGEPRWQKQSNGTWRVWNRDAFGRVGSVYHSNGTNSRTIYGSGTLPGARYSVSTSGSAQPDVVTEFNGLNQPIYRRSWDVETKSSVKEWGYDPRGRLKWESTPHFFGDAIAGIHEYLYDEADRLTQESHPLVAPSGTVTSVHTRHDHYSRTAYPASGIPKFRWEDFRGAQYVVVHTGPTLATTLDAYSMHGETLASVDASGLATVFSYGALGHLSKRKFLNAEISFTTDDLGRVTQIIDPSSGTHDYEFDGLGFTQVYRHNGAITRYDYDGLGRLTHSETPDGLYEWVWDGDGNDPTQAERLVSQSVASPTAGNATTEYEYHGEGGALSSIERTIEGESFTTLIEQYDSGLPSLVRFPGTGTPEATVYTYNRFGRVTKISDGSGKAYWDLVKTDAFGNSEETKLVGAGTSTLTSRRVVEPATGRLALIETRYTGGQKIQQEQYQYGPLGLLFRSFDVLGNVERKAFHDGHGRLDYQIVNNVRHEYDYDAYGNLTLKPGLGVLRYEAGNPYKLTSTANGTTFEYDEAGNGTQKVKKGGDVLGGRQEVDYTAFDLPTRIATGPEGAPTSTSTYRYDATHARTVADVPGVSNTVYVGDNYRRVIQPNGTVEQVYVIETPSGATVEVTAAGSRTIRVLHTDRLGSPAAITSNQVGTPEYRSYDPFGKQSSSSAGSRVTSGFTGHEHDGSTGLINMRGRIYDSTLGRFLSPDPIVQSPRNSQSGNGYSYVMNAPLDLTDPTGFCANDDVNGCLAAAIAEHVRIREITYGDDVIRVWLNRTLVTPIEKKEPQGAELSEIDAVPLFDSLNIADQHKYLTHLVESDRAGDPNAQEALGQIVINRPVGWAKVAVYEKLTDTQTILDALLLWAAASPTVRPSDTVLLEDNLKAALARFESVGFTPRQARRIAQNPNLAPAYRGERIDTFFKQIVGKDDRLEHLKMTPRFKFGPDVFNPANQTWWDVTTPGQWQDHVKSYTSKFGSGTPLLY